jgi:hypothetical protein
MKTDPGRLISKERVIGHPVARPNMPETTLCPKCRYAVIDRWNYCPFCGQKLKPVERN